MDASEGAPMEGLLSVRGPGGPSVADAAGVPAGQPETAHSFGQGSGEKLSPGRAVNFFQVMQPGGELRLYRAESLTVGEVLAEHPGHILSLSSFRPLRLPSDTKLLRWNVYHLHSANNGRAITLDRQHERKSLRALHRRRALSAIAGTPSAVSSIGAPGFTPPQHLGAGSMAASARAAWSCDAGAFSMEPEQPQSSAFRSVARRSQSGATERNRPSDATDPSSYVVEQRSTTRHSAQDSAVQSRVTFAPWPPPQPPRAPSPTAKPRRTSKSKDTIPRAIPRPPRVLGQALDGATGSELRTDAAHSVPGTRAFLAPEIGAFRALGAEPQGSEAPPRPLMRQAPWKHMVAQEKPRAELPNLGGEAGLPLARSGPAFKGLERDNSYLLAKDCAILGHTLQREKALPPWAQGKPGAAATAAGYFSEAQGQRPQRLQRACPMTDVLSLQRAPDAATQQLPATSAPAYATPVSAAAPEHRMPPAMEAVAPPAYVPPRRERSEEEVRVPAACGAGPDKGATSLERLRQLQAQLQAQAAAEMAAEQLDAAGAHPSQTRPPSIHTGLPSLSTGLPIPHAQLPCINSDQQRSRPVTPSRGSSLPHFDALNHTLLGTQEESCMWVQKITAWDLSLVYQSTGHETEGQSSEGHVLVRGASSDEATLFPRTSYGRELLSGGVPQAMDTAGASMALEPFSRRENDDRLSSESSESRLAAATGVRLTCKSSKLSMGRCRSFEKSQLEVCQAKVIEKRMVRQHKRNPVPSRFKSCKKATLPPKWPSLATQLSCIEFWYLEQRV